MGSRPPEKRKVGRPVGTGKLTPEMSARICTLLGKACSRETAATRSGIGVATFHRWMSQGAEEESGPYRDFREAVMESEHQLYEKVCANFTGIMLNPKVEPGTRLNAQKFYLSHRHSAEWSTKSEVKQTGTVELTGQVAVTVQPLLSDEQLAALDPERLAAVIAGLAEKP